MATLIGSPAITMQYQILLQKPSEQRFVASVFGLPNVIADGRTEKEVIAKVKAALRSQLAITKVVTVEIEDKEEQKEETDPWTKRAGIFADDPTWDDYQAEIAAYRKQVDEEAMT